MQADTIILAVDELNNGTTVNQIYTRTDYSGNRSYYIGAAHDALHRDEMTLFRSAAKPTGNFRGVEKTSVKFTWDQQVPGADGVATLTSPGICDCGFSLPIGMSDGAKLELRQRVMAALDHAFMVSFQKQLVI